jgi:hypothetical protein
MRDIPKNDEISAGLVSDRCQFCGATFNGANQLSLHYKENIQRRWDKTEIARKKKLIEFPLEYGRTYEIKRIFTKVTVI